MRAARYRTDAGRNDGVTVVNDAYHANPASMAASLKTLAAMSRGGRHRTIAVLGEWPSSATPQPSSTGGWAGLQVDGRPGVDAAQTAAFIDR
jgi:hypothetical protein